MKTRTLSTRTLVALGLILAVSAGRATALQLYTVPATANIFSAGLSAPIEPSGGGAGTLPVSVPVTPGQNAFQFSASGSITENNLFGIYHGPDGRAGGFAEQVYAYGGISGIILDQNTPLAGVFLTASAPGSTAPPTLDFSGAGLGLDFLTLAPAIGQVFFIGDGQTSGSATQTFITPSGATRLFLGIPDTVGGLGYPGGYGDNAGSFNVTVTPVPEPGIGVLSTALAALFLVRRQAGRPHFLQPTGTQLVQMDLIPLPATRSEQTQSQ